MFRSLRTMGVFLLWSAALLGALIGCGSGGSPSSSISPTAAPADDGLNWPTVARVVAETRAKAATLTLDAPPVSTWPSRFLVGVADWPGNELSLVPAEAVGNSWRLTVPPCGRVAASGLRWLALPDQTGEPTCRAISTATNRARGGRDCYLLHGLFSGSDALTKLANRLAAEKLYDRLFVIDYPDQAAVSDNASGLARLIRAQTTADQGCDLIAHSLGGLIARTAVELGGLSDRAKNVYLLGTPNLGSDLARAGSRLAGVDQPVTLANWAAAYAVSPSGFWPVRADLTGESGLLQRLNQSRPSNVSHFYFTIAGNLVVGGIPSRSDGVVSVDSANWIGLGLRARSLTRAVVRTSHSGLLQDDVALDQLVATLRVQARQPS